MISYQFKIYKKHELNALMLNICKENKLNLTFLKKNEGLGGYNYAYCGGNEIMLAPFVGKNSLEKKLISFFHEFSHLKLNQFIPGKIKGYSINHTSAMQYELWVTMLGLNYAKEKYDILFSDESVTWLLKQNFTYKNHDGGEELSILESNKNEYILKYFHININNIKF